MRSIITLCVSLFLFYSANAQKSIKWVRCLGGSNDEYAMDNAITRDGNIISIGTTLSTNGIATGNHGETDILLISTNSNGATNWVKVIGGSQDDGLFGSTVDTVNDGNFIAAFSSRSTNGDISGNHGAYDMVFRKYTPAGALIWSKTYGGVGSDIIQKIIATPDGGILAIGHTNSHNSGDVGPNHNLGNTSAYDMWVIKLDANGLILWQRCYGGSLHETQTNLCLAAGGGYYLTARTESTDGDLANLLPGGTAIGAADIWLLKINAAGTILWSKMIGGNAEEMTPSISQFGSSLYLTFSTFSANRDISSNAGLTDIALFKFSADTVVWKKFYGSAGLDYSTQVLSKNDGLLYVPGISYDNNINGVPFTNWGDAQILMMAIDSSVGSLHSLRSYGGSQRSTPGTIKIGLQGEFIISGTTLANDHDFYGNHGGNDMFIMKLSPYNQISGIVYIDQNNNNVYDVFSDRRLSYMPVEVTKQGQFYKSALSSNGAYFIETDTGTYVTRIKPVNPAYFISNPGSFQTVFAEDYKTVVQNIKVTPVAGIIDSRVFSAATEVVRPSYHTRYLLTGQNTGTETISSGMLTWKKDSRVSVSSYSIAPSGVYGDSIVWNFSNLKILDSIKIYINVTTPPPPALETGDTLKFTARIFPLTGDQKPEDNVMSYENIVIGPLDPNDKTNQQGNRMALSAVQAGTYINYVIRFQNVGTAAAFNVVIHDTISAKLQLSTIESIASSHPFGMEVKENLITWHFDNINLPDSNSNEPGSHGFIAFRIKPVVTLPQTDVIVNKAGIYFDYNDAVVTNIDSVSIYTVSSTVLPLTLLSFTGKEEGSFNRLEWKTESQVDTKQFEIERSTDGLHFSNIAIIVATASANGSYNYVDQFSNTGTIYYRLKIIDNDGRFSFSHLIRLNNNRPGILTLYPNPVKDISVLEIKDRSLLNTTVRIINANGQIVNSFILRNNFQAVDFSMLPVGVYFLQTINGNSLKLTKQ